MRCGMLKSLLWLIFLSIVSFLPQPEIRASESPSLQWKNLQSEYRNPENLKPIILNQGTQSIYVNPMNSRATVERLNEALNQWEECVGLMICGIGMHLNLPREIKPGEEMAIGPDWPFAILHHKEKKVFVYSICRQDRPLDGRYRLVLRYKQVPWEMAFKADPVFTIKSPEFRVG